MSSAQDHAHVAWTCHSQVRGARYQAVSRASEILSHSEFAAEQSARHLDDQDEGADAHNGDEKEEFKGSPRSRVHGPRASSATARYVNVDAQMTPQPTKRVAWADAGSGEKSRLEESRSISPPPFLGYRRLCRGQRQQRQQQKQYLRQGSRQRSDESSAQGSASLPRTAVRPQGSGVLAQEGDAAAGSGQDQDASPPEGDAAAGSAREGFGWTQQKGQQIQLSVFVATNVSNEAEAAGGLGKPQVAMAVAPTGGMMLEGEKVQLHRPSRTCDGSLGRAASAGERSTSAAALLDVSCGSSENRGRAIGSLGPPLSRVASGVDAGRTAAAATAMAAAASAAAAAAQAAAQMAWLLAEAQRDDDRLSKHGSAGLNAAEPKPPRAAASPRDRASRASCVGCWSPGLGPRGGFPPAPAPSVLENLRGGPVRARREGFRQDELRSLLSGVINVGRTTSPAPFKPARRGSSPVARPVRGQSQG
eukprot:TRINITY_DN17392_c0_g1_i2.p1 TRINITY_DN17392_c0_g1~~TRINITY_DN17392_c0_g1_i2.p1  ORF type:complete len:476 (-),score=87.74 TRINITY_DN17392_c0_g1_i2:159-1586(-)